MGLRLGTRICAPHTCVCNEHVAAEGLHSLSCKKNNVRILRHNALNDIIYRSFLRASVPAVKEPPGLLRSDGKRPDGATQIPWVAGKCLTWDVTVTDTLAPSYVALSATSASNAEMLLKEPLQTSVPSILTCFQLMTLSLLLLRLWVQ